MSRFNVSKERLEKLSEDMVSEMTLGLSGDGSSLLMIPTYIYRLPTGNESGSFLALDFGGSTFRVILVTLTSGSEPLIRSETDHLDNSTKSSCGEELFDSLARCVARFLEKENLSGKEIPLGFTFSFPMAQNSLSHGTLVKWTKGFSCSGVVNENVAVLLNKALAKIETTKNVRVVALANDTAGTQVSGSLKYPNCHCGIILGTGTNAAYTEEVSKVASLSGEKEEREVVINMEWGNFGERGHLTDLVTEHDAALDAASTNPGRQLYEKMISGMYIGDLVRLELLSRGRSCSEPLRAALADITIGGEVVSDCCESAGKVAAHFSGVSEADCVLVHEVCTAVSDRAAMLAAAGVVAIWKKRGKVPFVAAVDGSVFIKHSTFATKMRETIALLGCNVTLEIATDGSGLGSALIAATA